MIRIRTLPSGVRIATDPIESVRSCAIGVWLEVGSRLEQTREQGLTHFIEHMLFKGTPRMNALELADELNRLGGQFNAHTGQENICLHARAIDEKSPEVLDLLSEMLLESTFPEDEIRRERNVILEEYKMYDDNAEDLILDVFYQTLWPNFSLGRPIIGTKGTIRSFSRGAIDQYLGREFDPGRILICLAGSFDSAACSRILNRRFGKLKKGPRRSRNANVDGAGGNAFRKKFVSRPIEQVHFCFGTSGPERTAADRYAFGLMNMVLGGGMSSRLFKEVREKRGLAYSIQSFSQPFRDIGSFGIVGSTSPSTLREVVEICLAEARQICNEGVSEFELELAKQQIMDSLLMSLESTMSRMMHLSESMLTFKRYISPEEIVEKVSRVTPDDVRRAAVKYLKDRSLAAAFIGPKGTDFNVFDRKTI